MFRYEYSFIPPDSPEIKPESRGKVGQTYGYFDSPDLLLHWLQAWSHPEGWDYFLTSANIRANTLSPLLDIKEVSDLRLCWTGKNSHQNIPLWED